MSKRRISGAGKSRFRANQVYSVSYISMLNSMTGNVEVKQTIFEVPKDLEQYMPIYFRAHRLMPAPKTQFMDPEEYVNELCPSIETLEGTMVGGDLTTDEILRAIAILGHTPIGDSIRTLARFTQSDHSLAKVADIALAECTCLLTALNPSTRQ